MNRKDTNHRYLDALEKKVLIFDGAMIVRTLPHPRPFSRGEKGAKTSKAPENGETSDGWKLVLYLKEII